MSQCPLSNHFQPFAVGTVVPKSRRSANDSTAVIRSSIIDARKRTSRRFRNCCSIGAGLKVAEAQKRPASELKLLSNASENATPLPVLRGTRAHARAIS